MDGTTMLTTNAEQPEPMTPRDSVQIDVGTALEKARWFIGVIWIDPAEEEGQSPTIQCRRSMQN